METSDLLVRINSKYPSFSKGQKLIADYIVENYDKAAFVTASKMGRTVGVSESTVVRFAYALGYDGYPELQRALQEMIRNRLTAVQRIQLTSDLEPDNVLDTVLKSDINNIRSTIDSVDKNAFNEILSVMTAAKRIYVVGIKSAAPLAQFLVHYLNFIFDDVTLINGVQSDIFESMLRINERDICIGISFPRYSTGAVEALSFAKEQGAYVAAITDSVFSPIAALADSVLVAKSDMASFADSLVAPLSVINSLIVGAGLIRKNEVYERLNQLENIWKSQRAYVAPANEPKGYKSGEK